MHKKRLNQIKRSILTAYATSRLLSVPFWGLFSLLIFILEKDLHATPLQLASFIAIRPVSAIFSPYWSQMADVLRKRLIPNLVLGNILKFIPFLFFPWIDNPWFYIFSVGFHMALCRGTIPAWIEVFKIKIPQVSTSKVCAIGSMIEYSGMILLPLFLGKLLAIPGSWRWLFPLSAFLGMLAAWPIQKIHIPPLEENKQPLKKTFLPLASPWKKGWKLLKKRSDFSTFQWGFFLGGAGIMLFQSVLPKYFNRVLHLSYTDLLIAMGALKGVGMALSSPLWVKFFNRSKIFSVCSLVTLLAALFPLLILSASSSNSMIYVAYLAYGVMQGGSELSWRMSGLVFAKEKNSVPFSSINVLAIGIRGLIFPYLGTFLLDQSNGPTVVLLFGMALCLWATTTFFLNAKKYPICLNTAL